MTVGEILQLVKRANNAGFDGLVVENIIYPTTASEDPAPKLVLRPPNQLSASQDSNMR